MRTLVTGANGFVGTHLVAHLRAMGDEVVESETNITHRDEIAATVSEATPEVVYHLAAQADVGGSWTDPVQTLRINVEGTLNVLDAARAAGTRRVLAVTSADVYGVVAESELPLDESSELRPVSPYAASKAAADLLCLQAGLGHGLEVIRVRSFNHLGPGQSNKFVASAVASRIVDNEISGKTVVRVGNLDARRDFTDVRDVVRAYRLLMERGAGGEVYHVCSGVDRPVQRLIESLLSMAATPMTLELDPDLMRPADLQVLRGDNSKLRSITGWQPEIDIETTLRDLLEFWRQNPKGVATPLPR